MSSSDNLPCPSSIVVAAVVGNDSTAADEVVVLVENKAGPGELSGARLAVLEATSRCWEAPCSALLARIHNPLVAAVSDALKLACRCSWCNARAAKRRVVDRGIVAASLLSKGAGVDLRVGVGVGPVHNPQSKTVLCLLGPLLGLLPQRLQSWVNQAAANEVVVVVNVTTKWVATLFGEGNTAALAEAAGKLASAGNSAGRGLATAALREGTALATTATAARGLFSSGGEAKRGSKEAKPGVHIFLWGLRRVRTKFELGSGACSKCKDKEGSHFVQLFKLVMRMGVPSLLAQREMTKCFFFDEAAASQPCPALWSLG